MAVTSYLKLKNHIEDFATQHYSIQKFASESADQMGILATESDAYPILYMTLNSTTYGEFADTYDCTFYCFTPLKKDRTNYNYVISDTNLILNDLKKWLKEGDSTLYDIEFDGTSSPIGEVVLDYVAGHEMQISIQVGTYCVDDIPLSPSTGTTAVCNPADISINNDSFASVDSGGALDIPVINSDSNAVGSISGSNFIIGDSNLLVNSASLTAITAENSYDLSVVNSNSNAVGTASGSSVNIGDSNLSVNSASFTGISSEDSYNLSVINTSGVTVGSQVGSDWVVPSSDAWSRPSHWLPIDELDGSEEKFVGIAAVFSSGTKSYSFRINATNGYNIDWGDGNVIDYANGFTCTHTYDYDSLSGSVTDGYKQVKITATKQVSGDTFNGLFYWRNSFDSNWLDVNMYVPFITSMTASVAGCNYLERIRFAVTTPPANMGTTFQMSPALKIIEIDWTKPTSFGAQTGIGDVQNLGDIDAVAAITPPSFTNCDVGIVGNYKTYSTVLTTAGIRQSSFHTIGNVDAPNATSLGTFLYQTYSLVNLGTVTAPLATDLSLGFRQCYRLEKVTIDCASAQNCDQMFYLCSSIHTINFLSDCSSITSTVNMFLQSYNIRILRMPNMATTFTIASSSIDAPEMVDLFNDLKDLSALPSETITITSTPASTNLTAAERLIATNKNWTIVG